MQDSRFDVSHLLRESCYWPKAIRTQNAGVNRSPDAQSSDPTDTARSMDEISIAANHHFYEWTELGARYDGQWEQGQLHGRGGMYSSKGGRYNGQ